MPHNLKIGCVPYLNAKPLIHRLEGDITLLPPARLASEFENGAFDIALLPVMYLLKKGKGKVLDGYGIGCDGDVKSVILRHDNPFGEIRSVLPDRDSLTSNHLAKVLFKFHWKMDVTYLDPRFCGNADAAVIIGDPALHWRKNHPVGMFEDLGGAWKTFAGLPFVFAFWVLRENFRPGPEDLERLRGDMAKGMEHLDEAIGDAEALSYLKDNIRHVLEPGFKQGIARFHQELRLAGLAEDRELFIDYF